MNKEVIRVVGVREHNLRNISVEIPRGEFVVVTGVSGSGKSSLAFNVLFSEGQRRFLDSMSAYARQFVEQLPRADLDYIEGIPPSVSIEQRSTRGGGKSTVATLTEVYHFLRLLYARLGIQYCPDCNLPVGVDTPSRVVARACADLETAADAICLVPVLRNRKGNHRESINQLIGRGYRNLKIDGKYQFLSYAPSLNRYCVHDVDIIIFSHTPKPESRLVEKLKEALREGNGMFLLEIPGRKQSSYSVNSGCPRCGKSYPPLDPYDFSFNNPRGWCPECRGFGETFYLPDVERGARAEDIEESWYSWQEEEREVCKACDGSRLKPSARAVRLPAEWFAAGTDFIKEVSGAPVGPSIEEITALNAEGALKIFSVIQAQEPVAQKILQDILPEIKSRLTFLNRVGLDYLTLNRAIPTLSSGETQRIRLAAQLGSTLSGVLYVLDEPTIGLHARDNERLIETLMGLRNRGNTLLVVEHDEDTMAAADHILDMGPGAGIRGGEVIFQGDFKQLLADKHSLTGKFLSQKSTFPANGTRRPVALKSKKAESSWLTLKHASLHNLKDLTVRFPLNRFIAVTGVSGSGKSTLVRNCLFPELQTAIASHGKCGDFGGNCLGHENLHAVYEVDQSPIGRTPRSVPATYVGFFDLIRKLFSQTPEARMRGFQIGRFSFNSAMGRCPACEGAGLVKVTMSFMPPAFVTCETCGGNRFNPETLDVHFQGKNIAEVLDMTVAEALDFFKNHPRILKPLQVLFDTGLDYMKLGQGSPTLSGGEAQRVKLVTHLLGGLESKAQALKRASAVKSRFFILEEPTIGLHASDVKRLVAMIQRLVDSGNTVLVIEHNYDLIAEADWLIDLGPEGGENGGQIVAEGTPEQVAKMETWTGQYLCKYLERKSSKAKSRRTKIGK